MITDYSVCVVLAAILAGFLPCIPKPVRYSRLRARRPCLGPSLRPSPVSTVESACQCTCAPTTRAWQFQRPCTQLETCPAWPRSPRTQSLAGPCETRLKAQTTKAILPEFFRFCRRAGACPAWLWRSCLFGSGALSCIPGPALALADALCSFHETFQPS